jgi:hypothetical protein
MGRAVNAAGERRGSRRVPAGIAPGVRSVRLRTGHETTLVDASQSGLAIETDARVSPGAPLDVVVVSHGEARAARALVIYAHVVAIDPLAGARYRVGLKVESAIRGADNVVAR